MVKRAKKKNLIYIFVLSTLSLVIGFNFLCPFISFADTYNTIYAEGNIYASGKLKLVDTNGIRYATSNSTEFPLPYSYSAENTVINTIKYSDIFTNGIENINVNEIEFRFEVIFDEVIKSNEFVKIKMSYRYQPGRASKLNFEKLMNNGLIGIIEVKGSGTPNKTLSFDEVNIINSTVDEISPTSYIYNLELEFRVPNNHNMYALDIKCPTVIVNQTLNSASTNANPMIFGLQNAEVLLNTTNNINKEDVENAQNEANRLDGELDNLTDGMAVPTPDPDGLSNQADPFSIVDGDTFSSFGSIFRPIVDSPIVAGSISLGCIFMLISYVFFGKR